MGVLDRLGTGIEKLATRKNATNKMEKISTWKVLIRKWMRTRSPRMRKKRHRMPRSSDTSDTSIESRVSNIRKSIATNRGDSPSRSSDLGVGPSGDDPRRGRNKGTSHRPRRSVSIDTSPNPMRGSSRLASGTPFTP